MNGRRTLDRQMIFHGHPGIDALESRLQAHVTVTTSRGLHGRLFTVEAAGGTASGRSIAQAIKRFIANNL